MSRVSIRFYSTLVPITGKREIKWIFDGTKINLVQLLKELCHRFGLTFCEQIFDVSGEVWPSTRIAVDGEFLPGRDPVAILEKVVLSGQTVKIFPPTDGG